MAKIKLFLVVINFCIQKHGQILDINAVAKMKEYLVVTPTFDYKNKHKC